MGTTIDFLKIDANNIKALSSTLAENAVKNHDFGLAMSKLGLSDYACRWEIESLFKCFKTSGFNLEDTHLTNTDKINNLLGIVAIGFTWAYLTGELECEKRPIKIKSHGRKEKSIFKVGLDYLHRILLYKWKYIKEYVEIIAILCKCSTGYGCLTKK